MNPTHDLLCKLAVSLATRQKASIDYLEVGVQEGHSLRAVLETGFVRFAVGIDTWGSEYGGTGRGSPYHVLQLLGDEQMCKTMLITGDSHTILRGARHPFNLICIDGDHSEAGGFMDLEDSLPLLAPGGMIAFDDIDHPKHTYLRQVAERFRDKHGLKMTIHNVGYGVATFQSKDVPASHS